MSTYRRKEIFCNETPIDGMEMGRGLNFRGYVNDNVPDKEDAAKLKGIIDSAVQGNRKTFQ